jgi:hypothetical protein
VQDVREATLVEGGLRARSDPRWSFECECGCQTFGLYATYEEKRLEFQCCKCGQCWELPAEIRSGWVPARVHEEAAGEGEGGGGGGGGEEKP